MAFLLEKLEVYKKALDLAEQITDLTENFPRAVSRVGSCDATFRGLTP